MVAEVVTEGTAAELADTAPLLEDAPPAIELTETPESTGTETGLDDATETEQDNAKSWAEHLADVEEADLVEHPRIKSVLARKEESLRQRIERDQQLRAGSDQQVQATVTRLMQMLDAGNITPQQFGQAASQAIAASRFYASVEIGRQLPDVLMGKYKIPVEFRERAIEAREQDRGSLDRFTSILIEGAVAAERGTTRLKDVPEGSALHKDIQSLVSQRVEADLRARGIESKPKMQTPPSTSRGNPPGSTALPNPRSLSDEDYAKYTPEQRRAMWAAHPSG